jgi:hypothetical protein
MKINLLIVLIVSLFFSSVTFSQKLTIADLFNVSLDIKNLDKNLSKYEFTFYNSDINNVRYIYFENNEISEDLNFYASEKDVHTTYTVLDEVKYKNLKSQVEEYNVVLKDKVYKGNIYIEYFTNDVVVIAVSKVYDVSSSLTIYSFQIIPK